MSARIKALATPLSMKGAEGALSLLFWFLAAGAAPSWAEERGAALTAFIEQINDSDLYQCGGEDSYGCYREKDVNGDGAPDIIRHIAYEGRIAQCVYWLNDKNYYAFSGAILCEGFYHKKFKRFIEPVSEGGGAFSFRFNLIRRMEHGAPGLFPEKELRIVISSKTKVEECFYDNGLCSKNIKTYALTDVETKKLFKEIYGKASPFEE